MKFPRLLCFTALLLAGSISFAEPLATPPTVFLRPSDLAEGARALQTASVEYRPASGSGPSVWLVGVAHLGTAEYFHALQQRLDRQTVVLYEGVGLHDLKNGPLTGSAGIQSTLAKALGLKFQLEAIDYRRPSFVNSDLQVPQLEEEVKKHGAETTGPAADDTLNQLVEALQGTGVMGGALKQMIGFLGASPQMRETTKLMMVEVLGQAGELLTLAQQASVEMKDLFDVILRQRNAVVMRDLRSQLGRLKSGESVAVFYGAAHMDEIAQKLRDELHYTPVATEWDTAFTADSQSAGIDPAQLRVMIQMMRSQLQPPASR
jgi:hypothetical protein